MGKQDEQTPAATGRTKLGRVVRPRRRRGTLALSLLAVGLGLLAGIGAFAFRKLIGLVHNLFFLGRVSWQYDTNLHTPAGPWGVWIALVPALGALVVVFLVKNFAPEARGHGVPEVMDAVYYARGVIRPVVALIKSAASALSIGSGGSVPSPSAAGARSGGKGRSSRSEPRSARRSVASPAPRAGSSPRSSLPAAGRGSRRRSTRRSAASCSRSRS